MNVMSVSRLKDLLAYDPETGVFTWRSAPSPCVSVGAVAGGPAKDGYWKIKVDGRWFQAHRLAWAYVYGYFPEHALDHISRDPQDNRISNLRVATCAENSRNRNRHRNNRTGYKGVTQVRGSGKYQARIWSNGKLVSLGSYNTPEAAHHAYLSAAVECFGEFATGGVE